MTLDLYDSKSVTTRKEHECAYCDNLIVAGTEDVLHESGKFCGDFFSRYACPDCKPLVGEFWDYMDCESADIRSNWEEFLAECHPELQEEETE